MHMQRNFVAPPRHHYFKGQEKLIPFVFFMYNATVNIVIIIKSFTIAAQEWLFRFAALHILLPSILTLLGHHVKCLIFLSDFKQIWIFSEIFKLININFQENSSCSFTLIYENKQTASQTEYRHHVANIRVWQINLTLIATRGMVWRQVLDCMLFWHQVGEEIRNEAGCGRRQDITGISVVTAAALHISDRCRVVSNKSKTDFTKTEHLLLIR